MHRPYIGILLLLTLPVILCSAYAGIWDAGNGNPLLPGYFADPDIFQDGATFYIYSTTDGYDPLSGTGASFTHFGPFGVWYSSDFVNWQFRTFSYPAGFPYQDDRLWAPSVTKGANGLYYMYYIRSGNYCYLATAPSPLGPWSNVKNGAQVGPNMFDTDVFRDTDGTYYVDYQIHSGSDYTIVVSKLDTSMDTLSGSPTTIYASGTSLAEGPSLFKRNGIYYCTFSQGSLAGSYNVKYAYSTTGILGTYTLGSEILQSASGSNIIATGGNTVLKLDTNYYIVYHRMRYPQINNALFRQICADRMTFNANGTIAAITPTNTGIGALAAVSVADSNVARGKTVTVSSAMDTNFSAKRVTDENNGTLWKAATTAFPQWLVINLGQSYPISRVETFFEYPTEYYCYQIQYSTDSLTWYLYADRTHNTARVSPVIDSDAVTARYLRITIDSSSCKRDTTLDSTVGIFEVKVRKNGATATLPAGARTGTTGYGLTVQHLPDGRFVFTWKGPAVALVIYNLQGRLMRSLSVSNGGRCAWDGANALGRGVYRAVLYDRAGAETGSATVVR